MPPLSKTRLIRTIVDEQGHAFSFGEVRTVLDALAQVGYAQLRQTGRFVVPGLARFVVVDRPARRVLKSSPLLIAKRAVT
jgi:DNA-binding protein HU-beta